MAGLIRQSYALAFGQLREARFRQITLIGAALSLALLFALYALMIQVFSAFEDEVFTFSDGTRMDRVGNFFSMISLATMLLVSVFLMAPVASLFTGLHLHAVADTVEARHFPALTPARQPDTVRLWRDSVSYFGLLFVLNLAVMVSFAVFGLLWGLVLFWGVNGWLLSREYTIMLAERSADPSAVRDFRQRHRRTLILAGGVLAILLSVPLLNLLMPVIGVAAFTHLTHALAGQTIKEGTL